MAIYKDLGFTYARNAGADLSSSLNLAAHIDTDGDVVLAGAGEHVAGFITEASVQDKPTTIQFAGIAKAVCGGTVTAGVRVAADAAGKIVAATTGDFEIGTALETGAADEIIPVLMLPGRTHA
jgi:hypothetical protein